MERSLIWLGILEVNVAQCGKEGPLSKTKIIGRDRDPYTGKAIVVTREYDLCPKGHAEPTYRWRMKGDRVNPDSLRAICDSLNDERGTGGQSKLARLLGWHHSTVWRKLTGKSPITQADELAIRQAVRSPTELP